MGAPHWIWRSFVLVTGLSSAFLAPGRLDEPTPLLRGDDPGAFEFVGIPPESVTIRDGEIRLSGKPDGYIMTKTAYRDYVLTFEWMYERPEGLKSDARFNGNGGLLIHIQPPKKVWPRSLEVQLAHLDPGNVFGISGGQIQSKKNPVAQKRTVKPVGEWNQTRITCKAGEVACEINGVEIARGDEAEPSEGAIGFQLEGSPMRLRKLVIQERDAE